MNKLCQKKAKALKNAENSNKIQAQWREMESWMERSASQQRGNDLFSDFKEFYLKAKARIWP
jgi:hypothetical protein